MKQVSLTLDDATYLSAEREAQKAGKSLPSLIMDLLARFSSAKGDEFDALEREEESLRARLKQQGRNFAAGTRLSRDELHDRHAIR